MNKEKLLSDEQLDKMIAMIDARILSCEESIEWKKQALMLHREQLEALLKEKDFREESSQDLLGVSFSLNPFNRGLSIPF